MTASTAAVLLVLFLVQMVVTANLQKFIMLHIFIGTLLAGPLLVKLSSVGYQFFGYYTQAPAFVAKGPPNVWLRLLAPLLLLDTLVLFGSGLVLALGGPPPNRLVFLAHAGTAGLWVPLIAVHVYAHIRQVPRALRREWGRRSNRTLSGRVVRLWLNVIALVAGAVAAIALMPVSDPWIHGVIHHGIPVPTPLIVGAVLAVMALLLAVPILRNARE